MAWKTLSSDVVLVIETFGFRICFEFLISNFRISRKSKTQKPAWFRLIRVWASETNKSEKIDRLPKRKELRAIIKVDLSGILS